ncbi:MAG: hypothetical protein ACOCMZ_01485 [Acetivibrio ethanolgignens]
MHLDLLLISIFMHTKGVSALIINASAVGMKAERAYARTEKKTISTRLFRENPLTKEKENKGVESSISDQGKALAKQRRELLKKLEEEAQAKKQNTAAAQNTGGIEFLKEEDKTTYEMLKRMLEMLKRMREMLHEGRLPDRELLDLTTLKRGKASSFAGFSLVSGGTTAVPARNATVWTQETKISSFVAEAESVNFSAAGIVKTADGREIGFNVDLELSRGFMEYTEMTELSQVKRVMTDPLVINLDTASATVSDQKFRFDLNADGVEDEMSYLNEGSGFLALDKNGDGRINDGTELFGARNGNGFSELAAYDSDGDGWIDEADDVYDKLAVWIKTADGTDRQLTLKEANVGAIYLGNVSTDYSLTESTADKADAQIHRTGVFLKESGQAGTIQHVDFAI